jgi:hypothetical protein
VLVRGSNTRALQDLLGEADQGTVVRYTLFLTSYLLAERWRSSQVVHLDAAKGKATPARKRR